MRINFDLDDLEAFLAVDGTGSFHLAATQLALSQSAVTRRVQKLEAALDAVLFDRTTRRVKPTLAAKRLRPRAEAILDDARETTRAIRDDSVAFAHQRNLVITVATIPTVIAALFPSALRQFRAAGHKARLRVLDLDANGVSDAVVAGEADLGICSVPSLNPGLQFETLFEDKMVLTLPASHELAQHSQVTWDQVAHAELILPARGTGNRMLIDDALARRDLKRRPKSADPSARQNRHTDRDEARGVTWTHETERSTTALAFVASGIGVAVLPLSLVEAQRDERITWRPLEAPQIARPVGLLTRIGQTNRPEVAALCAAFMVL